MRRLSVDEMGRVTRRVRVLRRNNQRMQGDLRDAAVLLRRAMVRPYAGSERLALPGTFSRRSGQYALLLLKNLESSCDRKEQYYVQLLDGVGRWQDLSVERIRRRLVERIPAYGCDKPRMDLELPSPEPPGLFSRLLDPLRRIRRRCLDHILPTRRRLEACGWPREMPLFQRRCEVWMARALEVAQAFDLRTVSGSSERDLERARQSIVREAGTRFDPMVVQALVEAWGEIVTVFHMPQAA